MTLIELGEISSGSATPPPPERRLRRSDLRWPIAAALALLTLVSMTASAVPSEPRGLRTLWSMPADSQPFILDGDTLYRDRVDPSPAVEAYDTGTGRLRWTSRIERTADWMDTTVPGLLILAIAGDEPGGNGGRTLALDERTGAVLWQRPGQLAFSGEHGVLLADWDQASNTLLGLRMVRARDGGEMWAHEPAEPLATWATGATWFATVTPAGRVEVHSLADGSLLRTGTVPWQAGDLDDLSGDYSYLHATPDMLLVVRQRGDAQLMSAFDAVSLRPAWTWRGEGRGGVFPCGSLICAGDRPGVEALDPATGDPVWSSPGWDYARPLDGSRMLYESHRDTNHGVVDARTGKVLTVFPNGLVTADPANGDVVVLAFTAAQPTELAVYRLHHDQLAVRGVLGGSTDQGCQLSEGRLVCMIGSGNKGYDLVVKAVG